MATQAWVLDFLIFLIFHWSDSNQYKRQNWPTNRIESGFTRYLKIQVSKEMAWFGACWREHWTCVLFCHYFQCLGGRCTREELCCFLPLLFLLGEKLDNVSCQIPHLRGHLVSICHRLLSAQLQHMPVKNPQHPGQCPTVGLHSNLQCSARLPSCRITSSGQPRRMTSTKHFRPFIIIRDFKKCYF